MGGKSAGVSLAGSKTVFLSIKVYSVSKRLYKAREIDKVGMINKCRERKRSKWSYEGESLNP